MFTVTCLAADNVMPSWPWPWALNKVQAQGHPIIKRQEQWRYLYSVSRPKWSRIVESKPPISLRVVDSLRHTHAFSRVTLREFLVKWATMAAPMVSENASNGCVSTQLAEAKMQRTERNAPKKRPRCTNSTNTRQQSQRHEYHIYTASALEMFLTPVVAEETMSFTTCLPITIVASGWIMDASVLVPQSDEDEKAALSSLHSRQSA
ncbi:hypothetical protein NP493_2432g00006 [Ridgeia piscesae]|uniref:Uncharacterized protein n=1 Tax=Ridgeia piscesae TaxID=27915 RepID=A0AAD9JGC3_RIDPI|nr:hypothetical protein NP493_2432g00006 [Ridgeia piscesae]